MTYRRLAHIEELTREGEVYLAQRIENGDEAARHEMIEANLHLVIAIAMKYKNRGIDLEDLIQEGNLGLHRATQNFNHLLGFRFGTHAQWWIRQRISRLVKSNSSSVRVSAHAHEKYTKAVLTKRELHIELGREPTDGELAQEMGLTLQQLGVILQLPNTTVYSFSLDEPPSQGERSIHETLADHLDSPFDILQRKEEALSLDTMLSKLTPLEERVVRMRYGLPGHADLELGSIELPDQETQDFVTWMECRNLESLRASYQ